MNLIAKLLPVQNVVADLEVASKKRVFEHAGLLFENNQHVSRNHVFDSQGRALRRLAAPELSA